MRVTLPTLTLALLLAAPATGFAQNKVEQQLLAELRMMQEQSQRLQLSVNALAESVKGINAKQEDQTNATRKAFADQKLLIDSITDSIRILREKGDDTNVRISTVAHELETLRQALQSLQSSVVQVVAAINAQPSTAPAATDPATGAPTPANTVPPVNQAAAQSPDLLYNSAFGDYASSRYDLAIKGFEAFLRTFPSSPKAFQAQFYIGESYYNQGKYSQAAQAYREVIDTYKKSVWDADAYYKRGMSFLQLNNKDQAKADFQYVIKNYAENNIAPLAKAALDGIK